MTYISYERCNAKIYFLINILGGKKSNGKKVRSKRIFQIQKNINHNLFIRNLYIQSVKFIPRSIFFNYLSLCRE